MLPERRIGMADDPVVDVANQLAAKVDALAEELRTARQPAPDGVYLPKWAVGMLTALAIASVVAAGSALRTVWTIEQSYVSQAEMLLEHREIERGPPNLGAVIRFQANEARIQRLEGFHEGREP